MSAPTLPEFSLKGKVAIVTGGGRGLGLEMSKALAESGAHVAMMYVSNEKTHDLAAQIASENNITCKAYKADIVKPEEVQQAIDQIYKDFGAIDILVANAGINVCGPTEEYRVEDWKNIFDVNVNGVFYTVKATAKYMLEKKKGSIIITSSISGAVANRPQLQTCYNASKGATTMLAKSLAVEWAEHGIRVNALCPGYMRTELLEKTLKTQSDLKTAWNQYTPMGRIGEPKELRGPVVFLASDASSYITGAELFVDGGYTCA
jgi:sorbose reductase